MKQNRYKYLENIKYEIDYKIVPQPLLLSLFQIVLLIVFLNFRVRVDFDLRVRNSICLYRLMFYWLFADPPASSTLDLSI